MSIANQSEDQSNNHKCHEHDILFNRGKSVTSGCKDHAQSWFGNKMHGYNINNNTKENDSKQFVIEDLNERIRPTPNDLMNTCTEGNLNNNDESYVVFQGYDENICELHGSKENNESSKMDETVYDDALRDRSFAAFTYAAENYNSINFFPHVVSVAETVINFFYSHPKITIVLGIFVVFWRIYSQLNFCFSYTAATLVTFLNPFVHSFIVSLEQIFRRALQLASTSQDMWEAFYCDFSSTWCQKFELLCDVKCSHVHRTIERLRREA